MVKKYSFSSAIDKVVRKSIFPLAALKVRSGDIIDAITPIFAVITSDLECKGTIEGKKIGGDGGGETLLQQEGCIITGIDVWRGYYFGRNEVIYLQVIWHKLTVEGIDATSEIVSEKIGTGNNTDAIQIPIKFRSRKRCYISDFRADTSYHTSGETFVHNLDVKQNKLPKAYRRKNCGQ